MSSKLNTEIRNISKLHILKFHVHRKLRGFLLRFPPRFFWKITLFQVERRKITSSLRIKQESYPHRNESILKFPQLTFALLFPHMVRRSGILVESDIFFCYSETLRDIKLQTHAFSLTQLYENDMLLKSNNVDILIIDGNCFYSSELELVRNQTQLQRLRGVRVIVDLPDCNFSQDGQAQIDFWNMHADLVIYHNPLMKIPGKSSKFLLWPGFPIPIAFYELPWEMKKDKLLMQGSTHRQREIFYHGARRAKLPIVSRQHNRNNISNIPEKYTEYIENIKSTKYIFTNGYLNFRESVIVGRAFETLASGSVLLYENGSGLSTFYNEYSDFLPINNVADLIEKFEFLSSNAGTAMAIGLNAKTRTRELYNSRIFWSTVLSMLKFT